MKIFLIVLLMVPAITSYRRRFVTITEMGHCPLNHSIGDTWTEPNCGGKYSCHIGGFTHKKCLLSEDDNPKCKRIPDRYFPLCCPSRWCLDE